MHYNSSSFHFEGGDDIQCDKCGAKFDVYWDTEYGNPTIGEHYGSCTECDHTINFGAYIEYTQSNKFCPGPEQPVLGGVKP